MIWYDSTPAVTPPPVAVEKRWPGCTITILGGGPSLTPADVRYIGERPHLTRVIAVKDAYLLAPWADVLYACDASWWRYYKGAPTFAGLKYCLDERTGPGTDPPAPYPGIPALRCSGAEGLELEPTALRTGHNSGYQAVNLAVHLGAIRIVLLGFDCWSAPDGRQNWFPKLRPHLDSPYPLFLQRFGSLVEPLKAAGVEVVNCSRFTMLRAFPRQPLEEVLP